MVLPIETILSLSFRFGMAFVYLYLFIYFLKGYIESKKTGFSNQYFLGFVFLFAILIAFHIFYGSYELFLEITGTSATIKDRFPWFNEETNLSGSLSHQIRPAYLIFYFVMSCFIATQIFPLEKAIGWKKNPVTKLIVICGAQLWILFIPALSYSYFAIISIVLGYIGMSSGFFLNIAVNIKLFKDSTGQLRNQSLYAFLAFFLLGIGLVLSMEVGWLRVFNESISYDWEVVVGSCIQILAAIFYRTGFSAVKQA